MFVWWWEQVLNVFVSNGQQSTSSATGGISPLFQSILRLNGTRESVGEVLFELQPSLAGIDQVKVSHFITSVLNACDNAH